MFDGRIAEQPDVKHRPNQADCTEDEERFAPAGIRHNCQHNLRGNRAAEGSGVSTDLSGFEEQDDARVSRWNEVPHPGELVGSR